jgi:hypothetical protein
MPTAERCSCARLAEILRAGAERAEITVEQVLRELKALGFSDIGPARAYLLQESDGE